MRARKPGALRISTSLGIIPYSSIYCLISESKERLKRRRSAICRSSWLLHGINRFSLSTIPQSFISVLFSPKILSFLRKFSTMNRRSGLLRSSIEISCEMICRFFILRSIYKSSARFSSRWNATNNTFSCFFTITANLRSSFRICSAISSYSGLPLTISISSILVLNSFTRRM